MKGRNDEKNCNFLLRLFVFFAYFRSNARTARRGRRLVRCIWKHKKGLHWHSDRVGRLLSFCFTDLIELSSTTVPTLTRPVLQVGGGFRFFR